jgi:uncharacterized protein YfaS (alpha-2-macroglobulin family)
VVRKPFTAPLSVGALRQQLQFVAQGRYLPRSAWKHLAVRHVNTDKVTVEVRQIAQATLPFWLSDDRGEDANERNSDVILKKEIALGGALDKPVVDFLPLEKLLPSVQHGVLEIALRAEGAHDARRLLFTDLNLVAKREEGTHAVRVWAIDLDDLSTVSGVEVKQIVRSGRVVSRCSTDRKGACTLAAPDPKSPDASEPFALVASRGDDLTYLRYEDVKTEAADVTVGGDPYDDPRPYRAALYGDRGVYRPGETAHAAAVVRAKDGAAPRAGMPVEMKLVDPRGKTTRKVALKTDAAGLVAADFRFPDSADTGKYRVTLAAAGKPLGERAFNVEEFVPERMKVSARAARPAFLLTDGATVDVSARYLFGGSAEGASYELSCSLKPAEFTPPGREKYAFGVWRAADSAQRPMPIDGTQGELGEGGVARGRCAPLPSKSDFAGAAELEAAVAVMEAGSGRATETRVRIPMHPEKYYLGLVASEKRLSAGTSFTVEGVVVDWDGNAVAADREVTLELVHVETEYDWGSDDYGSRYERREREASEGSIRVQARGGAFSAQMTAHEAASTYVVRARAGHARTDLRLDGRGDYWWWSPSSERATPKPQRASSVAVETAAPVVVGRENKLVFTAPYKGRALVTVETDRVLAAEWVDATAGRNEWPFTVGAFVPNVYLTALVVKDPRLDGAEAFLPDRAFGVKSARVDAAAMTGALSIHVPGEIRSGARLAIDVDTGSTDPAAITVAAVDEGVLQLTGFETPDPLRALLAQRRLGTDTYETIGWNAMLPTTLRPAGGGDDEEGAGGGGGRVQPIKPVALWSGVIELPSGGKTRVTFDVPTYRGALRVMAVSASPKRIGHAAAAVTVRDPIVVETTLPRFLLKDDTAQVPVFVSNLSGEARTIDVRMRALSLGEPGEEIADERRDGDPFIGEPPVAIAGGRQSLKLKNGASGKVVFDLTSRVAVGAARIFVEASSGGLASREQLDLPLAPATPHSRTIQRVELAQGSTDLKPLVSGWLPTTEKTTFWVTTNPYGDAFAHLGWLMHYPYGCIEQTTSTTRPLLYLSDLIRSGQPDLVRKNKVEELVAAGIDRVLSMQTPSGGFAYWPGGGTPVAWGSAYATHLLLDAKRLKYAVPEDRLHDALAWIERELTSRIESLEPRSWDEWEEFHAEPYMQYVLAVAGRARKARIDRLIEALEHRLSSTGARADGEDREALYMLQAALYLAGDRRYEGALRRPDASELGWVRKNGWSFYSDLRRRGMMLSIFGDLFGADPAGEALADRVASGLRGHASGWYTTQELVWAVTGLGKRVAGGSRAFHAPTLAGNGRTLAPARAPDGKKAKGDQAGDGGERSWTVSRASEYRTLALALPEKDAGKLYLIVRSEGVRSDGSFAQGSEGIEVRREFQDAKGGRISLDKDLSLGDVAVVELTLRNTTSERVQNIALTDRFPAGMEVENPRLGRGADANANARRPGERDEAWEVDYMDVRDDRIALFGALEPRQSRTVRYALRVVVAGRYALPPVEAEAMYDPAIWARGPVGRVTLAGPWAKAE